ncbi:MAG: hypothetical protein ABIJ47_13625 [Candidatus Bathyarchaeota archaeon]|jgi:hypothetical protein
MSNYEMGAFEALEWAWNLLRTQSSGGSVNEATVRIQEMLFTLGSGNPVNFRQKTSDLKTLS